MSIRTSSKLSKEDSRSARPRGRRTREGDGETAKVPTVEVQEQIGSVATAQSRHYRQVRRLCTLHSGRVFCNLSAMIERAWYYQTLICHSSSNLDPGTRFSRAKPH